MAWRVARSLEKLLAQINAAYPKRSKRSDGSIGDAAHAASKSDHNPNSAGVVTARDFTHDPGNGLDCHLLAEALVRSGDRRIKYVIWNRRIWSEARKAEGWRQYTGSNPHDHHLHLSVDGDYDSTADWDMPGRPAKPAAPAPKPAPKPSIDREHVKRIQRAVRAKDDGYWGPNTEKNIHIVWAAQRSQFPHGKRTAQAVVGTKVDGDFGPKSKAARVATTKALQAALGGLTVDGDFGPKTDARYKALKAVFYGK